MKKYKQILKEEGLTISKFASLLEVSRPTVYKMLEVYKATGKVKKKSLQDIFDAYFSEERNSMKGIYLSRNGNLVVEILQNTAENANGTFVKGSETRGKRDIVEGLVLIGDSNVPSGTIIYFSYYAAQPFVLEQKQVYIVNKADIKLVKKNIQAGE